MLDDVSNSVSGCVSVSTAVSTAVIADIVGSGCVSCSQGQGLKLSLGSASYSSLSRLKPRLEYRNIEIQKYRNTDLSLSWNTKNRLGKG